MTLRAIFVVSFSFGLVATACSNTETVTPVGGPSGGGGAHAAASSSSGEGGSGATSSTEASSTSSSAGSGGTGAMSSSQAGSTSSSTGGGGAGGAEPPNHAIAVAAGDESTCAVLQDHSVKCWGGNEWGELGLGDTNVRGAVPNQMGIHLPRVDLGMGLNAVAVSCSDSVCAVLSDGGLKCWGDNHFGDLGLGDTLNRGDEPNEMGDALPRVDLGTGRTVKQVSIADAHACAVLDNGSVKCWGAGGQLGLGDDESRGDKPGTMGDNLPAVDLGMGRTGDAVAVSDGATCALLDNGTVKCWGDNMYGELGQGDNVFRGDVPGDMGDNLPPIDLGAGRTAVAIGTGATFTCALLDNATVKCWGESIYLGLGDSMNNRGDNPGEMGDNLPVVDLGTGRTAKALSVGWVDACALLDDGGMKCWGLNDSGELGVGSLKSVGFQPGQMGDNLAEIALGTDRSAVGIAESSAVTCALLDDGSLKCWGTGGELGQGDDESRGDKPNELGDNLLPIQL